MIVVLFCGNRARPFHYIFAKNIFKIFLDYSNGFL
ncbi:hypothetical protein [Escherichia phage L27]|uniref:Uncharacterized protein n=1 Tax=Escherichia phage L27 TaxID=2562890 RepID=A0A455XBI6_9CAUD|nr:hypothetical protein [Escherichia phage L27]